MSDAGTMELIRRQLDAYPRRSFCHLPTPLEKLSYLSRKLGLNLYIKRDDQTGLAFGGNKARKLEFILADALAQDADSIITWAGVQSNWCRQTAAAARRLGMQPYLVLFKRPGLPAEVDGNFLLDQICGADITVIELAAGSKIQKLADLRKYVGPVIDRVQKEGKRPYIAPIGGSLLEGSMERPLGAVAYAEAMLEVIGQAKDRGFEIDDLVFTTSSGSTHAGLLSATTLLSSRTRIVGISVSDSRADTISIVEEITNQTLREFEVPNGPTAFEPENMIVFDEYIGAGYGMLNRETVEAITTVAEAEGILLDPVYTGKAMSGFLDLCKKGYFRPGSNVVFLHTGGTPALFPYRKQILEYSGQTKN
jgi:D-cysteine desulfhydrase family pyridoxal phosphate-dependent enzyme